MTLRGRKHPPFVVLHSLHLIPMVVATVVLAGTTTASAAVVQAEGTGNTKAAASWLDISSRVGVVAVVLFGMYLLIFSGRLRSDREFKELIRTHQRELAERDLRFEEMHHRLEAVVVDRDAWKIAAGNALEGLHAFERTTAASLEEKSVVMALVEAMQNIVQQKGGGSG